MLTPEGQQELERGIEAWGSYLKQSKEPKANTALLVSSGYFSLAEIAGERALKKSVENVEGAAKTQRVAAEAQPTINSLTTLAIYEYYAGNFAAGDKAVAEAEAKAPSKAEAKEVGKQMAEFRKRGKAFEKQKKEAEKEEAKAGKERLQNPLGGSRRQHRHAGRIAPRRSGPCWARTSDLEIKSLLLYQLS